MMANDYWEELVEGGIYHLYNKVSTGITLFKDLQDYHDFLMKWDKYFDSYFHTYAYCLLPNHFHFLVQLRNLNPGVVATLKRENTKAAQNLIDGSATYNSFISDQFRRFGSSVALRHNAKYNRTGPIFMKRIKRKVVSSQPRLSYLLCYIHHNAIHHGLSVDYEDWDYSSYSLYKSDSHSRIAKSRIFEWIGGFAEFDRIHKEFRNNYDQKTQTWV